MRAWSDRFRALIHVATKFVEQGGRDHLVQDCGREHATENDQSHGIENFFSGLARAEKQGEQADKTSHSCHHHGTKSLQAAPNDHVFRELFAFVLHQVNVVRNHHDPVPAHNPNQGDEPHPVRYGQAGRADPKMRPFPPLRGGKSIPGRAIHDQKRENRTKGGKGNVGEYL